MSVQLEVSIGEALDKLSILQIKSEKIADESRLVDVRKELEYLEEHLKPYRHKFAFFYEKLYETNLQIWNEQDVIRENLISDDKRDELYRSIVDLNDSRFLIKKKLNGMCQSNFKEQKGYKPRKVIFVGHLGLGDHITMIGAVRYLSVFYDEVVVTCTETYLSNVARLYSDDPSIVMQEITHDNVSQFVDSHPTYDVFRSGVLNVNHRVTHPYFAARKHLMTNEWTGPLFLIRFYNQLGFPFAFYSKWFTLPYDDSPTQLLERIRAAGAKRIVFVHRQASTGSVNLETHYTADLDDPDTLVLNVNENEYTRLNRSAHRFAALAESLVMLPLLEYVEVVKQADAIYVIDSCFFSLMMPLELRGELRATRKCIQSRGTIYDCIIGPSFEHL